MLKAYKCLHFTANVHNRNCFFEGRGGRGLSIVSQRDVVREAKERFCFVDPLNGLKPSHRAEEQVLKLPDGNIIIVGEEAHSAPELMFKPELAKKSYKGLHELIYESVMKCEEQYRSRLLGNIVLTGGNSLIGGLDTRIEKELSKMLPNQSNVKVNAQNGRDNFTWKGGVHLCSLSSFQGLWLTKQDYMETGNTANNNNNVDEENNATDGVVFTE